MGANRRSDVIMTDEEIASFVESSRTATLVTLGEGGHPHAVAMWFAVLDGEIWFETKAKAQKAINVSRDPRVTVLIEDGLTYDVLRGVSVEGRATVVDDPDAVWRVGVSVWERYTGPYTDDAAPYVRAMLHNRIALRVDPDRVRSWDHRKLGLDPIPLGGTTATPPGV